MEVGATAPRLARGETRPFETGLDLTAQQLLLWAGQRLEPRTPRYGEVGLFTLDGDIDPERFSSAIDCVVAQSDALRTAIDDSGDRPRQRALGRPPHRFEVVDLSRGPAPEVAARVESLRRAARGFDPSQGLFESALFRVATSRWVWFVHQHQLVSDAWSFSLLFDRVARRYASRDPGRPRFGSSGPPLFADYLAFEARLRASDRHRRSVDHWRAKLGAPVEPLLPYGERMPFGEGRVERRALALDRATTELLHRRAAAGGAPAEATLFVELCTALVAFLHLVSGARRVRVGVPFANRPTGAFKDTLGSFMHVCPLVLEVGRGETFASLREQVARELFEAARHQHVALANPPRDRLYEVVLNLVRFSGVARTFDGHPVAAEWPSLGFGNVPLAVAARDLGTSGDLVLDLDLGTEAFGPARRAEIRDHLERVVSACARDADLEIQRVPLLSGAEERTLLVDWNATDAPLPGDATVVDLVAERARRHPDRVAVEAGASSATYGDLARRAARVAARLAALQLGSEAVVGVLAARGIPLVVALLGVLRAGAVYLPLEPLAATRRTLAILASSGCVVVLRDRSCAAVAGDLQRDPAWPRHVVCLTLDDEEPGNA